MAAKYKMPKGYKGHPRVIASVDNGTQFGRKTIITVDESYVPEKKEKVA